MPTLASRILLAIEMFLLGALAIPYFFMFAYAALAATADPARPVEAFGTLAWMVPIGSFLFAAYRVAFEFIRRGPRALRTIHSVWWWLSFAGAAYVALTILLASYYVGRGKDFGFIVEATSVFGLLYLVPLAHVLLEKTLRKEWRHAA